MECGGGKPGRRFSFSWADEVEREEEEQQQQERNGQPPRREEQRGRAKPDPFSAARPREVVLAEKGVDWRACDGELHASHRVATCCRTRAQRKRDARAAAAAATLPLPTQTPLRRHADAPTPMCQRRINAPPVSYSGAWGSKRKCARDVSARQVRPVADQDRRRVFGELSIGECGNSSCWSSKKSCNSAGTEGIGPRRKVAAADGENGDSRVPMMAGAKGGGSGVGRKRRGRGRQKMATKQQTLLL